jgi:hypothetical protein
MAAKSTDTSSTPRTPTFIHDDGGRAAAGFHGRTRDCVARAIAIAAQRPYRDVYDALNQLAKTTRLKHRSSSRTGIHKAISAKFLKAIGWHWTPTMKIGSGCTVHLRPDQLPPGRLIVSVSKHLTAVIDGVIHDTYDCSKAGTRCVYGYWNPPATQGKT